MASNTANPGVVYFDTNVYGMVAEAPDCWNAIRSYLLDNDLFLGLSEGDILELHDAHRLRAELAQFLCSVPSVLIKLADTIVAEEVAAYPKGRTESLVLGPISGEMLQPDCVHLVKSFFDRKRISNARSQQRQGMPTFKQRAQNIARCCDELGLHTEDDAAIYAPVIVAQWLGKNHADFLTGFRGRVDQFRGDLFKSLWLFGLVQYYVYRLHKRRPLDTDFGDLHHVFSLPYCQLVVMEKYLCQVLNHIKRNDKVLANVEIRDIDFVRDLTGLPLGRQNQ